MFVLRISFIPRLVGRFFFYLEQSVVVLVLGNDIAIWPPPVTSRQKKLFGDLF